MLGRNFLSSYINQCILMFVFNPRTIPSPSSSCFFVNNVLLNQASCEYCPPVTVTPTFLALQEHHYHKILLLSCIYVDIPQTCSTVSLTFLSSYSFSFRTSRLVIQNGLMY